jgi:hypothetical protein
MTKSACAAAPRGVPVSRRGAPGPQRYPALKRLDFINESFNLDDLNCVKIVVISLFTQHCARFLFAFELGGAFLCLGGAFLLLGSSFICL